MDENNKLDEEALKEQQEKEANSKTAHVALKGAATYFGGAAGNAAYNLADKLGVAKPIEDIAGKAVKYSPLNLPSKALNKVGALDVADKAIDMAGGKGNGTGEGLAKDGLAKEGLAKEGLEDASKNTSGQAKANTKTGSSTGQGSGDATAEAESEKKKPIWLFILIGVVVFFPFILILLIAFIALIGFLAPGLGVINFFSNVLDFFNTEELLKKAEEEYYEHLEQAQTNAFNNYNVCIDVNLIHATLTVNKLGDMTLEEGEEMCESIEDCENSKDVLTVEDYRRMEKHIDILANMQIKRKKYAVYKAECYTSSHGDRCAEGKEPSKSEKVTAENLHCADIGWLESVGLSWEGISFRDSTTPKLVSRNDKEINIFNFLSKKANMEKNYEYWLYIPSATYVTNLDGTETRKCHLDVPDDGYDFAELDIGDWDTMNEHIYFYNLLETFVEDYYSDYLTKKDGVAEEGTERYKQAEQLIDRIYDYYTLLGPNRNCTRPSEYICRDDEGGDYYGGGTPSLERSEFIEKIAPFAIEEMERTGVFASITIAQAAVESKNGASKLSSKYANYYGMTAGNCAPKASPSTKSGTVLAPGEGGNTCEGNAFWNGSVVAMCNSSGGDCQWYRIYDSFKNSTRDHSRLVSEAYGCNQSTYTEYLSCIVNKGYASASHYENTLLSVIDKYDLTAYDIGNFDGSVDPINEPQYTDAICNELGIASGDWANWKQYDPQWANVKLGPSTVGKIGCAMTSVAIQIMRSGVSTTLGASFNPGTFAIELAKVGGFDSRGNINWASATRIAPSFHWTGTRVYGSVSPSTIDSLVKQGNYVILNVKNGRHWVAVDRVEGNKVYMFDPGSGGTEVGQTYGLNSIVGYTLYRKG